MAVAVLRRNATNGENGEIKREGVALMLIYFFLAIYKL
jgi:hypothetical protein